MLILMVMDLKAGMMVDKEGCEVVKRELQSWGEDDSCPL